MTVNHEASSHRIIKSFEANQLKNRTFIILLADWLTSIFGNITFLIFNVLGFIAWIYINTGNVREIPIFDPFPFTLLTMAVSLEAIFLSIVVLMSQNKQGQISTLREEMDMQVNLIAEREITMILKLLKSVAQKMGVEITDEEMREMTEETDISYIQRELEDQINESNKKTVLPIKPSDLIPKNFASPKK